MNIQHGSISMTPMTLVVIRGLVYCPPWFYERINFLPVYGQCGFKFQLKEGQRAVLLPHIHPVTICGHV